MITADYCTNSIKLKKTTKLYPWFIWSLASCFLFYKYLLQVSPSIMVTDLMQHFNLSAKGLGHLAALYFYAYMLMQLPGGVLLDKIKLRKIWSLGI